MSAPTGTASPATCPNCNHPIPPGRRSLCPNCHYPLILEEQDDALEATADEGLHKPTERSVATETTVVGPALAPPPVQPERGGRRCASCGHDNPPQQLRCERCAYSLDAGAVLPAPAPEPTPSPRARRIPVAVVVLAALLLAAVLGYAAYSLTRRPTSAGSTSGSSSTSQNGQTGPPLVVVSRKAIRATASSTRSHGGSYGVKNTLDGDHTTAWNSNGGKVGAFARVTLTYKFSSPVHLRRVQVYNGYQKSSKSFSHNSRVRKLLVSTQATKKSFVLADDASKQDLDFDFGVTQRVVLTVEGVYRSANTKYKDVALSDVAFFRSE